MIKKLQSPAVLVLLSSMLYLLTTLATFVFSSEKASTEISKKGNDLSQAPTNHVKQVETQVDGPSWTYRNPEINALVTELRYRKQAFENKEKELAAREVMVKQSERGLQKLKAELEQIKQELQSSQDTLNQARLESQNTASNAVITAESLKMYTDLFKNLEPAEIFQIIEGKSNAEIAQIWTAMKAADVSQLIQYWQQERPQEGDRLTEILNTYVTQPAGN